MKPSAFVLPIQKTLLASCALVGPLTSSVKNFNKVTFTTYYIKKTAVKFTLNKALLKLNAHFCFIKNCFHQFIAFIKTLLFKKITRAQDCFKILPVCKLKKVEKLV